MINDKQSRIGPQEKSKKRSRKTGTDHTGICGPPHQGMESFITPWCDEEKKETGVPGVNHAEDMIGIVG